MAEQVPGGQRTCAWCGRSSADAAELLGWVSAVERGRPHHVCAACARHHVRAMEARLDPEHW